MIVISLSLSSELFCDWCNAGSQYDRWGLVSRAPYQPKKAQGTSWPHSITGPCRSCAWHCGSLYLLSGFLGSNLTCSCTMQAIFVRFCCWHCTMLGTTVANYLWPAELLVFNYPVVTAGHWNSKTQIRRKKVFIFYFYYYYFLAFRKMIT